uniref:Uncharacterized protein n=1 Tax=Chlamydomonas chlamydogama TaxID=225041 RepID=A0A7S2VVA1_9CHLO|mmetsp:Transcript_817/g.1858  ORF Transcript_817/g.1858 Transcript_817/m.1858 type:complete len:469 (+) Transcript_817:292-1698(+)|eukprot:CAMPEP_0202896110 /NCGR_PEP_ID=MMETSP1392-20130828/5173_1 /ASSEMBLY_ACC=CAM_ASM_000868 /TAXON_ID=225041 /ORGANISM="Chlamydomonas chlamydogama, Strain SAG 11-48b" /LENGTH=468 /DNA_ID=CAMNT_0049581349 /DNA_START=238 /DNA_END=1644 /DNA_ORIENTATION=+
MGCANSRDVSPVTDANVSAGRESKAARSTSSTTGVCSVQVKKQADCDAVDVRPSSSAGFSAYELPLSPASTQGSISFKHQQPSIQSDASFSKVVGRRTNDSGMSLHGSPSGLATNSQTSQRRSTQGLDRDSDTPPSNRVSGAGSSTNQALGDLARRAPGTRAQGQSGSSPSREGRSAANMLAPKLKKSKSTKLSILMDPIFKQMGSDGSPQPSPPRSSPTPLKGALERSSSKRSSSKPGSAGSTGSTGGAGGTASGADAWQPSASRMAGRQGEAGSAGRPTQQELHGRQPLGGAADQEAWGMGSGRSRDQAFSPTAAGSRWAERSADSLTGQGWTPSSGNRSPSVPQRQAGAQRAGAQRQAAGSGAGSRGSTSQSCELESWTAGSALAAPARAAGQRQQGPQSHQSREGSEDSNSIWTGSGMESRRSRLRAAKQQQMLNSCHSEVLEEEEEEDGELPGSAPARRGGWG